jgi:rhamnosyltransferase
VTTHPAARARASSVAAVVVTFQPDLGRLERVLRALAPQAGSVVIVDNGSAAEAEIGALLDAVGVGSLIALGENRGIAAGFNAGVEAALATREDIEWILTLDQDSILDAAAVSTALNSLEHEDEHLRLRCGIVGLRHRPISPTQGLWRLAERRLDLGDHGEFRERLLLISSGNLVRSRVASTVSFQEQLFMDQVDFAFCADVRDAGWRLLEIKQVLMDHRIGLEVRVGRGRRSYESGQRLYYIVRNSAYLMIRGRLPPTVFLAQLLTWSRSYLETNGAKSLGRYLAIVSAGLGDCSLGRFGPRKYPFLREPAGGSDGKVRVL